MAWADVSYAYKKKITIDHTKVLEDLTDFPILISVTNNDLKDAAHGGHVQSSSGYDIVFYDSTETALLYHEIEYYYGNDGKLVYWVKIPLLDHDGDTDIYMYYGKANVVVNPSSTSTWNASYLAVYHMRDKTGDNTKIYDSKGAKDLSQTNGATIVESLSGKVGDGYQEEFQADNNYASAALNQGVDYTIEFWCKPNKDYDDDHVNREIYRGVTVPYSPKIIYFNQDDASKKCFGIAPHVSGSWFRTTNNASPKNVWAHVAFTAKNNAPHPVKGFLDGNKVIDANNTYSPATDTNHYVGLSTNSYQGFLDELRISTVIRTDNWIITGYYNQNNPSTFESFGTEENQGGTAYSRTLSDTLSISDDLKLLRGLDLFDTMNINDSLIKLVSYKKILSDSIEINEIFYRQINYVRKYSESIIINEKVSKHQERFIIEPIINITDNLIKNISFNRLINDNIGILDSLITAYITPYEYSLQLTIGGSSVALHKPYFSGAVGNLSFDYNNFSFKSGNYTSYIDSINSEIFTITGYEYNDALNKLTLLGEAADDCLEIAIHFMGTVWDNTYIIENISYEPIGVFQDNDVFEYKITFKKVSK
jgi:hypothetical protein